MGTPETSHSECLLGSKLGRDPSAVSRRVHLFTRAESFQMWAQVCSHNFQKVPDTHLTRGRYSLFLSASCPSPLSSTPSFLSFFPWEKTWLGNDHQLFS